MTISYPDNTNNRAAISASGLTDSTSLFDVVVGGSERKLTLAELKKTGVQVINVKQYGAVGDGVTDDTAAIQAAITAGGQGAVICIPKGTFTISETIELLGYQRLVGSGLFSIIDSNISDGTAAVKLASYSSVSDIRIQGPGSGVSSVGLLISGGGPATPIARGSITRVRITDCQTGFAITNCHIWTLHECYATSCVNGVQLGYAWVTGDTTATHAINFIGGEYTACTEAFNFRGQGSVVNFIGVTIEANSSYGIHLGESNTSAWSTVNIDKCYFEENGTANIYLETYARLWTIEKSKFAANATACYIAIIGGNSATGGRPYNTTIRNCQYAGSHPNAKVVVINAEANDTIVEWHKYHNIQDSSGISVSNNGVNTQLINLEPFPSFASTDATPSVAGLKTAKTANASATTITSLDDGTKGQTITIVIGDANTTVDFTGTALKGNGGVDWSPASGDHMVCTYDGTNWYCIVSEN